MVKKLWTSIPQLSVLIVILALFKAVVYYNAFNVPIKYFTGLSELGLFIASDLFITIPLCISIYLFLLIFLKPIEGELSDAEIRHSIKANIVVSIILGLIILFLIIVSIIELKNIKSLHESLPVISLLLFLFFCILASFRHDYLRNILTTIGITIVMCGLLLNIILTLINSSEIKMVENGKYKGTKIVTLDSTYNSSDSAFYIGQTTNYIFFYNKKDKHTSIIPTREVKKFELFTK